MGDEVCPKMELNHPPPALTTEPPSPSPYNYAEEKPWKCLFSSPELMRCFDSTA